MDGNNPKGFFSFLGVLLSLVIIMALMYYLSIVYLKKEPVGEQWDEKTQEIIQEQGIDRSSHQAVLQSTLKQIEKIEHHQQESADKILRHMQGVE